VTDHICHDSDARDLAERAWNAAAESNQRSQRNEVGIATMVATTARVEQSFAQFREDEKSSRKSLQTVIVASCGVIVAAIGAAGTVGAAYLTREARGQSAETARQEVAKTQPSQEQLQEMLAKAAQSGARTALRERDQQVDRLAAVAPPRATSAE